MIAGAVALANAHRAWAAASLPALVAPASDAPMEIAVHVPADLVPDRAARWRLAGEAGRPRTLPIDWAPASDREGMPDPAHALLLATLPPAGAPNAARRFVLEPDKGPRLLGHALPFRFEEATPSSLALWEGARRVMVYNHGVIRPQGVPADRYRSTYVHPLYGLEGEVLTDDAPADHHHHHGLFWAWPHVRIDEREYDLWTYTNIEPRFVRWLAREPGHAAATLAVENGWFVGERKVMTERVWLRAFRASDAARAIDLEFTWIPADRAVGLAGAEGKSYGGLTLRFAPRTNTVITTPLGNKPDDLTVTPLPWADLSASFAGARATSGAAVFIAPDHPDYPPTWLTRHYGALCVGWPGVESKTFAPGQPIRCRYRVWVHRGGGERAALDRAYRGYAAAFGVALENAGTQAR